MISNCTVSTVSVAGEDDGDVEDDSDEINAAPAGRNESGVNDFVNPVDNIRSAANTGIIFK